MSENSESKQLPCPFCSGVATVTKSPPPNGRWWVKCETDSCADGPIRDTPEDAEEIWSSVEKKAGYYPHTDPKEN